MAPATAKVLAQLLELPCEERKGIAEALLRSLDDPGDDAEWTAAWRTEIGRRLADLASGASKAVPWEEMRARLHDDLRARREARGR